MPPTPVSFTVRRPTPVSRPSSSGPESDGQFRVPALPRHLASAGSSATGSPLTGSPRTFSSREDSDDDGEVGIVFANDNDAGAEHGSHHSDSSDGEESLVAGAPRLGHGQRLRQKKKHAPYSDAPLVIPTQPNPDWREAARKRRAACSRVQSHAPSRATPGGPGTRDTINSGPQLSGLQIKKRAIKVEAREDRGRAATEDVASADHPSTGKFVEETEDEKALRAILAGEDDSAPAVEVIPVPPLSEAEALKQDVEVLPDVATAEDYERVPISAFGAAMLRGMGWTEGAVASKFDKRRKTGLREPYLPRARPALLGIGAKEREPDDDDGSGKKKRRGADMRYVPVARKESGRGGTTSVAAKSVAKSRTE